MGHIGRVYLENPRVIVQQFQEFASDVRTSVILRSLSLLHLRRLWGYGLREILYSCAYRVHPDITSI